jgi:hypothetical protein
VSRRKKPLRHESPHAADTDETQLLTRHSNLPRH